jgi:uncharacterized surface protein with fasciclin (FAS1) repeats
MKNLIKALLLVTVMVLASCEKESISDELTTADLKTNASVAAQKSDKTIADIVVSYATAENEDDRQFTLLLEALNHAKITSMFTGTDQFTVFAPTDAAFKSFLKDNTPNNSLSDLNPEQVAAVLSYHVTNGRRFSNSVVPKNSPRQIETLLGPSFYVNSFAQIDTNDDDLLFTNATISKPNISASNGVIHVIDKVLVPATN